jgi:hypothetical protein
MDYFCNRCGCSPDYAVLTDKVELVCDDCAAELDVRRKLPDIPNAVFQSIILTLLTYFEVSEDGIEWDNFDVASIVYHLFDEHKLFPS